jgi:ferric-dicitrate binding protein FerR (iron transport regulator)
MRYAAVVLIAAGVTIWYIYNGDHRSNRKRAEESEIAVAFPDSKPGEDKAVLTLDDGSTVLLDSTGTGLLSRQGQSNVMKERGGELVYEEADHVNPVAGTGKTFFNTVNVPRGGQFRVVLPDGSKVWLNAASSLRFPTVFAGASREVFVTGEAYFEIAPLAAKPFYAKVEGMSVEVLGTSFNINAYKDEKIIRTTLLDGKVRVRADQAAAVMQPGQQAVMAMRGVDALNGKKKESIKLLDKANIGQVMAWKNGEFYLDNTDIAALMRQIGRWYAIDVEFEGGMPSGHITGKVPRSTALPKILRMLKLSGVHFRVEEKKIIVSP